jgi:hypothetical protein
LNQHGGDPLDGFEANLWLLNLSMPPLKLVSSIFPERADFRAPENRNGAADKTKFQQLNQFN